MEPTKLEGWLTKDKKSKGFGFGSTETRRWFKVKEIDTDHNGRKGAPPRMALCYYKNEREREPRGWMFLGDITNIREAGPKCGAPASGTGQPLQPPPPNPLYVYPISSPLL